MLEQDEDNSKFLSQEYIKEKPMFFFSLTNFPWIGVRVAQKLELGAASDWRLPGHLSMQAK